MPITPHCRRPNVFVLDTNAWHDPLATRLVVIMAAEVDKVAKKASALKRVEVNTT